MPSFSSKALAFFFALAFAASPLNADVFSLWPGAGRGGGGAALSSGGAADVLSPKKLWSEPVVVNGCEASLGIALIDSEFESCVFQLRSAYPKASYAGNSSSLLMETKLSNGRLLKVCIVEMPGVYQVLQFSMELPEKLPEKPQWPSNMPLPPSSTPLTVMQFPKRGSSYGLFSSSLSADQALTEMRKGLITSGWRAAGGDGGSNETGGEVYIREKPLEIAIVGASTDEKGATRGSVYTRALREAKSSSFLSE